MHLEALMMSSAAQMVALAVPRAPVFGQLPLEFPTSLDSFSASQLGQSNWVFLAKIFIFVWLLNTGFMLVSVMQGILAHCGDEG